jgi:BirA family biotin operon repressor/biotin-[acetyl-CoA-carboxylase] ligase
VKLAWRLARMLGDGRFHSGEALAADCEVSRTMVWRAIHALEAAGLVIHSVTGKGYRLAEPVDWLDADALEAALPADCRKRLASLKVLDETDSTNRRLLDDGAPEPGDMRISIAEHQTGGRGRRGRRWQSPPGGGIWLSVSWLFERQPPELTALGLAAGLAVRRALAGAGVGGVLLKWPNDLVHDNRKLGGLLVELRAESQGPAFVVVGVGVNWLMPRAMRDGIAHGGGLPVTDVTELCRAAGIDRPDRTSVAASIVAELGALLADYETTGFGRWRDDWALADALVDRSVRVEAGGGDVAGTARGIDRDGALLIETAGGLERVIAGDVSVRPAT